MNNNTQRLYRPGRVIAKNVIAKVVLIIVIKIVIGKKKNKS